MRIRGVNIDYKRLRKSKYGGIDVVGFGICESGVLEGETLKVFLDNYETEEEAFKHHPDAEGYTNKFTDPSPNLNFLPGENDFVPGGALPDDI